MGNSEFAAGSQANWNNFELTIPNNAIVCTTDMQIFKRGNSIHRFSELTVKEVGRRC